MPQIWMTYEEIAGLLDCSVEEAREQVQDQRLDRKKSRDGKTRAKLCLPWIGLFIAKLMAADQPVDRAIRDLRQAHGMMSRTGLGSGSQALDGSADLQVDLGTRKTQLRLQA